jgi:hypothetical protein
MVKCVWSSAQHLAQNIIDIVSAKGTDRLVYLLVYEVMQRWYEKAKDEASAHPNGPSAIERFQTIYALRRSDAISGISAIVDMVWALGCGATLASIKEDRERGN